MNIKTLVANRRCHLSYCHFLLVTFAKANEGLDHYEQNELKMENSNIFQKGKLNMNIYNKVTLSVILVITIVISFLFYFLTTEKKVDKDTLYENKIANHKQSGNQKLWCCL